MSPGERRQVAINITWTWPAVIVLFILAMLPIYGPLLPPLEGALWPVTSKVTFISHAPVEGGMTVRMSYVKWRDCEIIGVSLDRAGVPVDFEPVNGSVNLLQTRGTGPQISQVWFVGDDKLEGLRLRWVHRCNPFFTTVTVAYP